MFQILVILIALLFSSQAIAGTVTRPAKSFGGTSFINGVIPDATDFNGDPDTIYAEFNGNIDNNNIKSAAAIAATKINPDGFTTNIRLFNAAPCYVMDESDQSADAKRWAACLVGGQFRLGSYTDANVLQNNWFTITRATGAFTIGGTSGSNVVNGPTTFNQLVTFTGSTTLTPTGMVSMFVGSAAPSGWLFMDGASNSCTGTDSANAALCAQLVSLVATVNYKGTGAFTVTADASSNEIVHAAHGHAAGDRVHFSTTNTLPAPLVATTVYCILSTTTDRYIVSTACDGSAVDITTTGTGTHSDYFTFVTPNTSGRALVNTGAAVTTETLASQAASSNAVVVASNTQKWITGMPVVLSSVSGFSGLTNGTWYLVRTDSTHVKFATTLANAQNGTVATVTGTGTAVLTYTGETRTLGEVGGEETHAMSVTELLAHTHQARIAGGPPSTLGGIDNTLTTGPTTSTGGNAAMNIVQPYLALNYIIKL